MYEHRCPENIKKLYKSSGKGDNQEQYKAICEAYMVSTSEGFTGNILISPGPYLSGKQPCAKKTLRQLYEVLDVNPKTVVRRLGAAK